MRDIELMLKQNGQKKKEMIEIQIQFIGRNINRQSEERKKNDFTTSSNMTSSVPKNLFKNILPKYFRISLFGILKL